MKYLQNRNQFLNKQINLESSDIPKYIGGSRLIKETFENDITWGGSLLGRFINSVIRKATIYYKATNIPRLLKQLESELLGLVTDASVDESDKKQIESITARFLIEKVYNIVISDDNIDKKLTQLIGDGENDDQGALNESINEVEKLEEDVFPKKEELLTKLKEFRDLLRDEEFETIIEDEEEGEEGAEEETSDKDEKEGGSAGLDDTQEKFLEQTMKFFKSIMDLSKVIESKIVEIEGSKNNVDVQVGKEYSFTNKQGKTNQVKVISLTNATGFGSDKKWLTGDDQKKGAIAKDAVFVIFKDQKGQYTSASPQMSVSKSSLSELSSKSLRDNYSYANEFLPILEDNIIRSSETQAIAVWKKILKAYSDSGMSKSFMNIQKIVEKKSGLSDKEIISLTYNVILNENTIGKPLKFDDLVKEDYNLVDPKYNSIPKSVSLFIKVITPLKEDMGLVNTLGVAGQPIKGIIESYSNLKSLQGELPKLTSKKKEVTTKEEGSKREDDSARRISNKADSARTDKFDDSSRRRISNESLIQNYNRFRLFEAVDKDLDEVTSAWFQIFKEGEEKEYSIDEKGAKDLQEKIENKTDGPFAIKEEYYDRIIKIVNIFGKAYKNYATDNIPSGRPEGRISLKTFREYKYIGSGTAPNWSAQENPGGGPWAAKFVFNKWEDGVMSILEKPELRKVLANARFLPKNVQELGSGETEKDRGEQASAKIVRAGRSLFDFINDLLAGEGEFMKIRRTVLKEYFGGADRFKDDKLEEELTNPSKLKPKKDEMSSENEVGFFDYSDGGFKRNKRLSISDFAKGKKYSKEFFRIKFKEVGNTRFIIGQFFTVKNDKLVLKFQESNGKEQSIISTYLSKDIKDNDWELEGLTTKPKNLFIGVVDGDIIQKGDFKFRTVNIDATNKYDKALIKEREIVIQSIEILGHNVNGKLTSIKKENPDNNLQKDINFDNIKTEDFTK